tara:strand:+ start:5766 stop:6050 length:285 start_codon:yes stop_codon:yes gene_type:complete
MKKSITKLFFGAILVSTLASCSVSRPLMVTDNTRGDKVGEASYSTILGFRLGLHQEIGAIQAAKNGGITKIATVDQTVYGGLFKATVTTVVTGE